MENPVLHRDKGHSSVMYFIVFEAYIHFYHSIGSGQKFLRLNNLKFRLGTKLQKWPL